MNRLKRSIGLPLLVFFGLGNILGAGIYVLIGKIAGEAGLMTPVAFLFAAIVAGLSALTYSELSARYPVSAGVAVYVHEGFRIQFLTRLAGFMVIAVGIVTSAAIARGFYGYLEVFFEIEIGLANLFFVQNVGKEPFVIRFLGCKLPKEFFQVSVPYPLTNIFVKRLGRYFGLNGIRNHFSVFV